LALPPATGAALEAGATLVTRPTLKAWAEPAGPALPSVSWSATLAVVHLAMAVPAVVATVAMAAADTRPDHEAGEEDDRDDEDGARDDADPGGHRGEPATAWPFVDVAVIDDDGCGVRRRRRGPSRGLDGARDRFGGRG